MDVVRSGDRVKVHFTGRLEDGTVFGSSQDRDPLEFTAGSNEVIPGLDQAVIGMQPGETRTVAVSAEDAFGPRTPGLEQEVPRSMLPDGIKVGDRLQAQAGERTVLLWVSQLDEESALLDVNHPLAGHSLSFDLELVSLDSMQEGPA